MPRYNLDYAAEWAREQAAIKVEHDKMMKINKKEKIKIDKKIIKVEHDKMMKRFKPAKPTKKTGG